MSREPLPPVDAGAEPPPPVSARARSREDRAGDPLDGLVNLFDLGIVLAVAFLLAALSSVKLTSSVLGTQASAKQAERTAPAGSVVENRDEQARAIKLREGQRVVGHGKRLGVVYQLDDGRTIIVRRRTPAAGSAKAGTGAGSGAEGGAGAAAASGSGGD